MHTFYQRYGAELPDSIVVGIIDKKIDHALKELKEDEDSVEAIKYLAIAMDMLSIYFAEKGVNPAVIIQSLT